MRIRTVYLLASTAIVTLPSSTLGNTAKSNDTIIVTGQQVPDAVLGASGSPVLIKDVPQGISVVPRELFEAQKPFSLSDIVRNTPSISNFRNSSETFRTFSVRGFTQYETSIDGFRNANALNIQPDGLASIESVEIIRGAAAALYGRGSLGAAVNIVTKKPLDKAEATLSLDAGSRSLTNATADITGPLGGGITGVCCTDLHAYLEDQCVGA